MPYKDKDTYLRYQKKYQEDKKEQMKKYKEDNKEKIALRNKKWREDNKEKISLQGRTRKVRKRYNITLEEYDTYFERGTCAICLRADRKLVLDHCHNTGKVRDALCGQCNSGIGMLNDNILLLQESIKYLTKHR